MKRTRLDNAIFVEYNDNNITHVQSGPDYGQVDSDSKKTAWTELASKEYPDYVLDVRRKILKSKTFKVLRN